MTTRLRSWTKINLDEAKSLYEGGESVKMIGARYGVTGVAVWKQLQRHFPGLTAPKPSTLDVVEAKRRWDTGETCVAIGMALGVSGSWVFKKLRQTYPNEIKGGAKARRTTQDPRN